MKNKASSLYIHIPFCEHICDYCDFTKLQYFTFMADKYLDSLQIELEKYHIQDNLKTIYVGGGTPTVLDENQLEKLLNIISKYSKGVLEYTFEANPETLNAKKLQLLKMYGVNRLSIGVESTNDQILASINRHHTFKDVENAIFLARKLGFDNINLDLILGLPNVSKNMLEKDINNILSLNPEHISCYSLTVNPHTVFYLKNVNELDPDTYRELYDLVNEKLLEAGYIHYEVSNWCKKNKQSEHNLTYWRNEPYYGVGLGASGYLENYRYTNTKSFDEYCSLNFIKEKEFLSTKDLQEYMIMLNLRTFEGLSLSKFKELFSIDLINEKKEVLNRLFAQKLLIFDEKNHKITATYEGMMVLDSIILSLI